MRLKDGRGRKWTAEEDARLRQLRAEGISYMLIAEEMKRGRNACIGRATRLDLEKVKVKVRKTVPKPRHRPPPKLKLPPKPVFVEVPVLAPRVHGRSFMELRVDSCRWPIGGDMYCPNNAVRGRPYCADHCRISYIVPRDYVRRSRSETSPS